MKALIHGKIYDTEKSTLIGDSGPYRVGTFDGASILKQTRLYKTKSGIFFTTRCTPMEPTFLGWLASGGYHSGWEFGPTPTSEDDAAHMCWQWGWDFKKAGLKAPEEA